MSSKVMMIGMLFLTATLGLSAPDAYAGNINTSAASCQPLFDTSTPGIGNLLGVGLVNGNSADTVVVCSVPRSPVTVANAGFWVDGGNARGTSTTCSVVSQNYTGAVLGTQSFTEFGGNAEFRTWDHFVPFPSAQLPVWAYVSLVCTLPGNSNGVLYGIISVF